MLAAAESILQTKPAAALSTVNQAQQLQDCAAIAVWFNAHRQEVQHWNRERCLFTGTNSRQVLAPAMVQAEVIHQRNSWGVFISPNSSFRWKGYQVLAYLAFWGLAPAVVLAHLQTCDTLLPLPEPASALDQLWIEVLGAPQRFWDWLAVKRPRRNRINLMPPLLKWEIETGKRKLAAKGNAKGTEGLTKARLEWLLEYLGIAPLQALKEFKVFLNPD